MGSYEIGNDLRMFQLAVQKLSGGVSNASLLWNDAKFAELKTSVSNIALQSKDLIVSGERCCVSINRFDKIADEKY